jgi:glucosyl-3-phosphoglycerate synthase
VADFHQPPTIPTLHRLNARRTRGLEAELYAWRGDRPIGLVLPALYAEFEHPAMGRIARELSRARYLRRVVVALGPADFNQYRRARGFFERFEVPVSCLRIAHPEIERLLRSLERAGFDVGRPGKGQTCWLANGLLLAHDDTRIVAMHDCDIRRYSRSLLAYLCFPLASPDLDFEFAKGYYARVRGRLFGRLTRLFVTPLVRALQDAGADTPLLRLIGDLRYSLSGEVAMSATLARRLPVSTDWGLEIGTLARASAAIPASRMCQVEVTGLYEHKHKPVAAADPAQGLHRMAVEVGAALLRASPVSEQLRDRRWLRSLIHGYRATAFELASRHRADAHLNALRYDEKAEREAITVFSAALPQAAHAAAWAGRDAWLPSWHDVEQALPGTLARLARVVEETDVLRPRSAIDMRPRRPAGPEALTRNAGLRCSPPDVLTAAVSLASRRSSAAGPS